MERKSPDFLENFFFIAGENAKPNDVYPSIKPNSS
jgi:hypothetical protein